MVLKAKNNPLFPRRSLWSAKTGHVFMWSWYRAWLRDDYHEMEKVVLRMSTLFPKAKRIQYLSFFFLCKDKQLVGGGQQAIHVFIPISWDLILYCSIFELYLVVYNYESTRVLILISTDLSYSFSRADYIWKKSNWWDSNSRGVKCLKDERDEIEDRHPRRV